MSNTSPYDRQVVSVLPVLPDKELHVSVVMVPDAGTYVDLREFIPSLDAYSRGVTYPASLHDGVLDAMVRLSRLVKTIGSSDE